MTDPSTPSVAAVPKRSGLAVTALVLGIVGLVLSIIPVINVVGILLGGLAVVFGIIGIVTANGVKRTGRGMAIAGLILGAVAVVVGIIVNVVILGALSAVDDAVTVDVDSSAAGGAAGTTDDPLPFGTEVTLENGLVVTVGVPTPFTPSSEFLIDKGEEFFWSVDVSISNNGTEDASLLGTSNGFLASGAACSSEFDSEQFGEQLFALDGSLPSGKSRSSTLAFACPAEESVELELTPDILGPTLYYSQDVAKP